jgi:hypothetical protein
MLNFFLGITVFGSLTAAVLVWMALVVAKRSDQESGCDVE